MCNRNHNRPHVPPESPYATQEEAKLAFDYAIHKALMTKSSVEISQLVEQAREARFWMKRLHSYVQPQP